MYLGYHCDKLTGIEDWGHKRSTYRRRVVLRACFVIEQSFHTTSMVGSIGALLFLEALLLLCEALLDTCYSYLSVYECSSFSDDTAIKKRLKYRQGWSPSSLIVRSCLLLLLRGAVLFLGANRRPLYISRGIIMVMLLIPNE
jgi:hypothetical protein